MRHILMSMRCSNQHRADNILKVEAAYMISIINSNIKVKKIYPNHLSSTILNQPYSQIEYITVNPNK